MVQNGPVRDYDFSVKIFTIGLTGKNFRIIIDQNQCDANRLLKPLRYESYRMILTVCN